MSIRVANTQRLRDAERILQDAALYPVADPVAVILVGLPGSGKSHLARATAERTGAIVLESDAIRRMLFAERRYTRAEHRRVFAAVHTALEMLLDARTSVILDSTNLAERERLPLHDIAARKGARTLVVQVTAPDIVARQRIVRRGEISSNSEADERVYEQMRLRAEPIRRPHVVVDTWGDTGPAQDSLTKEMMQP